MAAIGRWKETTYPGMTPGETCYSCGKCGGTVHLFGAEYRKRKILCDICGRINIYPGEKAYEVGSSLWEGDETEEGRT